MSPEGINQSKNSAKTKLSFALVGLVNILGQGLPEVKPVETKALALGDKSETVVREAGNVLK